MELQSVYKVYSGKANRCMCGCSGKYATASAHAEFATAERGYDAQDVNDRSVKIIAGKVLRSSNKVIEGNYAFVEQNGRILVAYFKE